MKKAVHFGAGNIGRGFIGQLLHQAGFEVVFADVVPALIETMNRQGHYRVIALDANVQVETVDNVRAVALDSAECELEIVHAGIVTTAVGVGNLQGVAGVIAKGLKHRYEENPDESLNIMACENAIRATSTLKKMILNESDAQLRPWIEKTVGFADVAVDRIAPNPGSFAKEPLDAVVEKFFEWDVESTHLQGDLNIPGATFVEHLDPFLERKLFLLNGAHAAAAYAGYRLKKSTILEAMQDSRIEQLVAQVQSEAGSGLEHAHSTLTAKGLEEYAENVRKRFLNPHIRDEVVRVGRDPLRKLSHDDRFIRPLLMARNVIQSTPGLITAIALGFLYDYADDPSAVKIQEDITQNGLEATIQEVTGCSDNNVVQGIAEKYREQCD